MRSDFYNRCADLPELVALKGGSGQYDLLPPTFGEIGRMVRQPAAAAGLGFDEDSATGQRLDEALHEAAFKSPEALPLLEFTLDELYRRRTDAGRLTWSAYREMRGLEGAIGHYAESVFQNLDPTAEPELPALLRAGDRRDIRGCRRSWRSAHPRGGCDHGGPHRSARRLDQGSSLGDGRISRGNPDSHPGARGGAQALGPVALVGRGEPQRVGHSCPRWGRDGTMAARGRNR